MSLHTVTFTSGAAYPDLFRAEPQPNGPPKFFLDPGALAPMGGKVYNGTGFASSGASLGPPPAGSGPPAPYTLTFTKAGSYEYGCLFHLESGMFARITVTEAPTLPLPNTGVTLPALYFPITGYGLGGAFLSYWKNNGSLEVFGYPIDSERQSDGKIFQWLERNRLEMHPENSGPYNILLGRLGAEVLEKKGIDWTTLPKVSATPEGCRYFAETGHSLCGDFLNYWQSHGLNFDGSGAKTYAESLALFGLPLSEPRMETNSSGDTVITQWFERARFEYHPNNPSQYRVLLGRLGAELYLSNVSQN
jgi:plastocyanin